MKRFLIFLILFAMLFSCGDNSGNEAAITVPKLVTIKGKAEKGPLQKGAIIQAAQWSPTTGYSGAVFVSATINDLGGYTLEGSTISGLLDASADGFFINENTGTVSDSRIVISGLIDSETQSEGNINIITHIIKLRVMALIRAGSTFAQANNQAVTELFAALNWSAENPLNTSIATNPRLLFLSAAICKDRTVDQVSDILTALTADMEDGSINISVLDDSFYDVDCAQVEANIFAMYGVNPDIDTVRDDVIAFRGITGPPPIIRIVDPIPSGDFHYFTNTGQLSRLNAGALEIIQMRVTIKQDGESDIVQNFNCIDFFKIGNVFYFSANYDSTVRYYSQENGVVAEIGSLPAKPEITRITPFNDGLFSAETIVYEGTTCTDIRNLTMSSGILRNIMVSEYCYGSIYSKDAIFFVVHDDSKIIRDSGLYYWIESSKASGSILKSTGRMWK
jgi:hypothetical protein